MNNSSEDPLLLSLDSNGVNKGTSPFESESSLMSHNSFDTNANKKSRVVKTYKCILEFNTCNEAIERLKEPIYVIRLIDYVKQESLKIYTIIKNQTVVFYLQRVLLTLRSYLRRK